MATKFEPRRRYSAPCDITPGRLLIWEIANRDEHVAHIRSVDNGGFTLRVIRVGDDGVEYLWPLGGWPNAPILRADSEAPDPNRDWADAQWRH